MRRGCVVPEGNRASTPGQQRGKRMTSPIGLGLRLAILFAGYLYAVKKKAFDWKS